MGVLSGNPAGHSEGGGVGKVGHRVQCGAFLVEHLDRTPTRGAVHAGIDLGDEHRACRFHVGETGVLRQQVVSVGTMSALASLTAFSTPPLEAGSAG
jgi:hypothetical protein